MKVKVRMGFVNVNYLDPGQGGFKQHIDFLIATWLERVKWVN